MDKEFITDLAIKYANVCRFKSDFPHHEASVKDGFIEGFETALRLIDASEGNPANSENANCAIFDVSQRSKLLAFLAWYRKHPELHDWSIDIAVEQYEKANCG